MPKIKLDSTVQRKDRQFDQHWTITLDDGTTLTIESTAEWHPVSFDGPNPEINVAGTSIPAWTVVGMALGGYGPVNDGEEAELGAGFVENAISGGYLQSD